MERHLLTPEERAAYDELMYEAGHDSDGKPRPSHEIGQRVVAMLREAAEQAREHWAGYVLEDILAAGALTRWKGWNKRRVVVNVAGESYVAQKSAVMSVRRKDPTTGASFFQPTFWDDMTRDDLTQLIDRSAKQINSEKQTIGAARRLLSLLDEVPTAHTVSEAMEVKGTTTDDFLGEPEQKSA